MRLLRQLMLQVVGCCLCKVCSVLLLQDSASVQQAAVPIMHELVKNANVFLVTHVIDDVGEATVRGALEDVGLVGTSEGQIKPHRLVFCSTLEGKVSIVRQLEPELHIDGHPSTVCSYCHGTCLMACTCISVVGYLMACAPGCTTVSRCSSICAHSHACFAVHTSALACLQLL